MGDKSTTPSNIDTQLKNAIDDIASTTSEVNIKNYFSRQILNDITMNTYKLEESMRIWLIEFRQQAEFAGVENMSQCIRIIGRFMSVIRNWITTVPVNVKQSWSLFAEALNNQFGRNSLIESREIKAKLKSLKQAKNESIKLHSAKWKHLLSLLNVNEMDDQSKKVQYIQSLYHDSVRTLLANSSSTDVDTIILQSITITDNAGLELGIQLSPQDPILPTSSEVDNDVRPMEIDYVGRKKFQYNQKWKKPFKHNNKQQGPPRVYDKQSRPICGYCKQKHRTIDCHQHKKNNHRHVSSVEINQNSVYLHDPTSHSADVIYATSAINHLQQFKSSDNTTPVSDLIYNETKGVWYKIGSSVK